MHKLEDNYLKIPIDNHCIQGQRAVAAIEISNYHELFDTIPFEPSTVLYQSFIVKSHAFDVFYKEYAVNGKLCIVHSFSDTLFCIAHDDTETSFGILLVFLWRLFQAALAQKIVLRGTLSYGDIFIDPKHNMVLGDSIVRVAQQYKNSNWFGIDIDNIATERYHKLFLDHWLSAFYNELAIPYRIPQVDGTIVVRRAINWRFSLISETGTCNLFALCSNPSLLEKKTNSLNFAKYIVSRGNLYIDTQNEANANKFPTPTYIRNFYIGSSKPPFVHGDTF
jgi:hypothetical protein